MSVNPKQFDGRVVLVTGSSSGIGAATAIKFATLGAKVVVTGRNAHKILEVLADLTVKQDIQRLVDKTVSTFGRLDVLVNNAGIVGLTDIEESGVDVKVKDILETNVHSVVLLCHLA
ncbi:unnamed protein product, partial [Oppiella nova]